MAQDIPLPDGWTWTRLGGIGELLRGVSYHKEDSSEQAMDGLVPILRSTNIQDEKLILDRDLVYVPNKYIKSEQFVQPGDIVVCMSSGSKNLVGKTAQLTQDWKGSFGTFCATIRPHPIVNAKFVGYFFSSPAYRQFIRIKSAGININNLKPSDFETLEIPFPPMLEQERIVDRIESLFTQLDASVAGLKRVQAALKRYKASVLKAAVEGFLVDSRMGNRELGEDKLPNGWRWILVGELILGTPTNGLYLPKEKYGTGIPILRIDDFQNNSSRSSSELRLVDATPEQVDRFSLRENDLVVNRVNSMTHLGKSIVISARNLPALFESNMMRIQFTEDVEPKFVELYFHSIDGGKRLISNAKWAVNQASINQKDVANTPISLPPLDEQRRIVAEVERRLSVVSEIEATVQSSITRAARLRQAILKRAFEGRLVTQNPSDKLAETRPEVIGPASQTPDPENFTQAKLF